FRRQLVFPLLVHPSYSSPPSLLAHNLIVSSFPVQTSLKPLDVQFMKAIHNKVNVVPVIAKADTLTLRERERLKRRASIPFAVVGSNQQIEAKGKKVRGRLYPWGVVEVENPEHNDFLKLRTMLITHMQDLQEVTQDLHYENFRSDRLKRGGRLSSHGYVLPLSPAYVLVCLLALSPPSPLRNSKPPLIICKGHRHHVQRC
ncbi:Septin-2, partial [Xenoophorus captivus]